MQSLMMSISLEVPSERSSASIDDRYVQGLAQETENVQNVTTVEDLIVSAKAVEENRTVFKGGFQILQLTQSANIPSLTYHIMCKDFYSTPDGYFPVEPTTIFSPSDSKAACLITASVNQTIEYKWYYRNDSSKNWVSCYNWSQELVKAGPISYEGHLWIAGYAPAAYCPRAFKVEVYLDGFLGCSDFFEVTPGGLNSPRTCESVAAGYPVQVKSRFTIGSDQGVFYFLRFDQVAYFNEELERSHNFSTVWIQPDGSPYHTYSGYFTDYKDANMSWTCWQNSVVAGDCMPINSTTPSGNWKVELYLDSYYNQTSMSYGPIASTPFVIGNSTVSDWTFMVYLDADNSGETAGIETFLHMAAVGSSPQVNVVVQMDRIAGGPNDDARFDNWTDCKRFYVTTDMTPTSDNAISDMGEVDMADVGTLKDFINWTMSNYLANHYVLVLWDHGAGCLGCCEDYTNGNDSLTLPKLSQALSGLPAIIDVMFFDDCSMSMAEVAYQIRDYANIMIGPEALGYSPGFYEAYLFALVSNSSMSPYALASEIVRDYMVWCNNMHVSNATMSAFDLTKITALTSAINNFALRMKEKETPYNELIELARNLTEEYPGPTSGETGYYIDLYHLAQLTLQNVPDAEVRDAAGQLMGAISDATIMVQNISLPNSHGLAVYFPADETKYNRYKSEYYATDFADETVWGGFLENHFTGHLLTIQVSPSFTNVHVMVGNDLYMTDARGRVQVFVSPGYYDINSTPSFVIGPGSRGIFIRWQDDESSNVRTFQVNAATTLTAEYQIQHELIIAANAGMTNPSLGMHWVNAGSTFSINATAPDLVFSSAQEQYVLLRWNGTGDGSYSGAANSGVITMNGPINETAIWRHEYYMAVYSLYGLPSVTSNWFDAEAVITVSVAPQALEPADTQHICIGWTQTGNVIAAGNGSAANVTVSGPSTLTWNWKTQYHIYVYTEPAGLYPQPAASSSGPWYDNGTILIFTAQNVSGKVFDYWTVDDVNYDRGFNPISLSVDGPHRATAHYLPTLAWWDNLLAPQTFQYILLICVVIAGSLAGGLWVRSRRIRAKKLAPQKFPIKIPKIALPGRIPTGCESVDDLLCGGIPNGYSVALTSPSCDERDLLVKSFLEEGAEKNEVTFYVTVDPGELKSLAERYPNFHLFICNPQADTMIESSPNIFKLNGVENLTEVRLALTKAFRGLNEQQEGAKRACIGIVSDVLLHHHALQTRRWLLDLIPELRSKGFTTLGLVNLPMHSAEEVQAIQDVFEGQMALYEKDTENGPQKFLRVKKMINQKYLEYELPLKKESFEKQKGEKTS